MNPILAAAIPSVIAGGLSALGGERANQQNLKIAREQMDFQREMSGSSYQRAMADMKLAGINPMLAYQQGGASTPGGQSATMENIAAPAVSSAMHARRLQHDMKVMNENIMNLKATRQKTEQEARLIRLQGDAARVKNIHWNFTPYDGSIQGVRPVEGLWLRQEKARLEQMIAQTMWLGSQDTALQRWQGGRPPWWWQAGPQIVDKWKQGYNLDHFKKLIFGRRGS